MGLRLISIQADAVESPSNPAFEEIAGEFSASVKNVTNPLLLDLFSLYAREIDVLPAGLIDHGAEKRWRMRNMFAVDL
jgi:hypothetical protein